MKQVSILFIALALLLCSCREQTQQPIITKEQAPEQATKVYQKLQGQTMGTTWHITYAGDENTKHQKAIDSILVRLNEEVSTYIPSAIISQFNQSKEGVALNIEEHAHFIRNYKRALEIYKETEGQFDPTVMPLVNYWGFGYTGREKVKEADKQKVKALLDYVGMDHVELTTESFLTKDKPQTQIDFSALAKGYGVDELCRYLDQEAVTDYFVEIGGEVNTKGQNPRNELWSVGISRPEIESAPNDFYLIINLDNKAIATSGNYRNVYIVDGIHYFHTIDPITGFPKKDRLLSASVIADDCMTADAYATAFMVMGLEKAMAFAKAHPELGVCFIYNSEEGILEHYTSEGMKEYVEKI